ncbi:hypothetical protein FQN54_008460 [Arachnomyces sp. PD_36]|nr:hypothetical protein FQN54_008460 [Arachnomyces sp. PD_36]
MSVVASRPSEHSAMSFNRIPSRDGPPGCKSPLYPLTTNSVPSRSSSASSYVSTNSTYSTSTVPTIYSPTSANSSFLAFKAAQQQAPPQPQGSMPKHLPQEVYDCVLTQLQYLHTGPNADGCLTCSLRDLHALALTNRAWERAVRAKLYNKIHILGNDSPAQLKKYKCKRGSRLKLLRRTLRERKLLANLVLELRVPELDHTLANGKQNAQLQEYRDLVASVVMVCPNLERLVGFAPPYYHEFDRLTHALSTRKQLKEHTWIIGENAEVRERSRCQSPPGLLDQHQVYQFLNYHASWTNLETLMLQSLNMQGIMEHGTFLRMFNLLPSLRHLCLSGFDTDDFTDRTLLFLPPLVSLRLENLRGVTENGLAHYASRPEARCLQSLSLIEQNITSLLVISKILASLRRLERFNIVQTSTTPTLPSDLMVFQPLLASSSLQHLHWDIASIDPVAALSKLDSIPFTGQLRDVDSPNSQLAQSILNAGFPSLKSLRAPQDIDPPGALQSVCRPARNAKVMLPSDRYSLPRSYHGSTGSGALRMPALPAGNNLVSARIRAQTLIDLMAKDTKTGMKVLVTDHSETYVPLSVQIASVSDSEPEIDDIYDILGPLKNKQTPVPLSPSSPSGVVKVREFTIPSCMGRVLHSGLNAMGPAVPRFNLRPDLQGADSDGGLIAWGHFHASNQTSTFSTGCSNSGNGNNATNPAAGATSSSPTLPSGGKDDPPSPGKAISRFPTWGSSAASGSPAPMTPTSPGPSTGLAYPSSTPPWAANDDTCTGSWNQGHKGGKEWWSHIERARPGIGVGVELVTPQQFF